MPISARSIKKDSNTITQYGTSVDGTVCVNGTGTIRATGEKRLRWSKHE